MKIKNLTMHPYGFFLDKELEFNDGLNLIYGDNESGKSTLFSAIRTVIYGFYPATREKHPYMNWELGHGKVTANIFSDGELFKVERRLTHAPQCVVSASDKNVVFKSRNDAFREANAFSYALFSAVFHLKTSELDGLKAAGWKHIEGKFSDIYHIPYLNSVSEVLSELQKESLKLWRPDRRGNPEILALEKKIYDLEQELYQLENQEEAYIAREMECDTLSEDIKHLELAAFKIEENIRQYKNYEKLYQYYSEMKQMDSEIDHRAYETLLAFEKCAESLNEKEAKYHEWIQLTLKTNQEQAIIAKREIEKNFRNISLSPLTIETYQIIKDLDEKAFQKYNPDKIRFYLFAGWVLGTFSIALLVGAFFLKNTLGWMVLIFSIVAFFTSLLFYKKSKNSKNEIIKKFKGNGILINAFLKNPKVFISTLSQLKVHTAYIDNLNEQKEPESLRHFQSEILEGKRQLNLLKEDICQFAQGDFSGGFRYCKEMKEKNDQYVKLKERYMLLNNDLQLTEERLCFMEKTSLPELLSQQYTIETQIREKKEKFNEILLDLERLKTYDKIECARGKIEDMKTQLSGLRHKKNILSVANKVLKKAQDNYKMSHQPQLLKVASQYLSTLTFGKYKTIYFDEENQELSLFLETDKGLLPYKETFSQGTVQQIFLSLRLAYMDILDPEKKMPLMLDDVFAAWDEKRMTQGVELLRGISEFRQVFFFTCSPLVKGKFKNTISLMGGVE